MPQLLSNIDNVNKKYILNTISDRISKNIHNVVSLFKNAQKKYNLHFANFMTNALMNEQTIGFESQRRNDFLCQIEKSFK